MKKAIYLLIGGVLASAPLIATSADSTGTVTATAAETKSAAVTTGGMITNAFTVQLSKGVSAGWTFSDATGAVQTKHASSKHGYGGSTQGGSVNQCSSDMTAVAAPTASSSGC
ncbi:hypothetical protein [Thermithiobacillus plumbiphilus]|uniref:Uncharacterized protein n=1 Tax=Thermithiobacillus plumbiphilus TaxID=1729899 RepID=A0ABU9DBU6_9PROT